MIYPAEHFGCWFYLSPTFIGLDDRGKEEDMFANFSYDGEEGTKCEGARAELNFAGSDMSVWVREDDVV